MKKLIIFIGLFLLAQNLYFTAFQNVQKAKKLLNQNPQKAQTLFIEASSYLKQIINSSIDINKPSVQALSLLGEMYLNGWGVENNSQKRQDAISTRQGLNNLINRYSFLSEKKVIITEENGKFIVKLPLI